MVLVLFGRASPRRDGPTLTHSMLRRTHRVQGMLRLHRTLEARHDVQTPEPLLMLLSSYAALPPLAGAAGDDMVLWSAASHDRRCRQIRAAFALGHPGVCRGLAGDSVGNRRC